MRLQYRTKLIIGIAVAALGFTVAMIGGPIYSSYFWPEAVVIDPAAIMRSGQNIEEFIAAFGEASAVAKTANQITDLGKLIFACGIGYTIFITFTHYRSRSRKRTEVPRE